MMIILVKKRNEDKMLRGKKQGKRSLGIEKLEVYHQEATKNARNCCCKVMSI